MMMMPKEEDKKRLRKMTVKTPLPKGQRKYEK